MCAFYSTMLCHFIVCFSLYRTVKLHLYVVCMLILWFAFVLLTYLLINNHIETAAHFYNFRSPAAWRRRPILPLEIYNSRHVHLKGANF